MRLNQQLNLNRVLFLLRQNLVLQNALNTGNNEIQSRVLPFRINRRLPINIQCLAIQQQIVAKKRRIGTKIQKQVKLRVQIETPENIFDDSWSIVQQIEARFDDTLGQLIRDK